MPWYLAALVGCYSATAQPGAPCSPAAPFCPVGQSCVQAGTDYMCLAGAPPGADAAIDMPATDAPRAIDAAIDAPPDAAMHWTLLQVASAQDTLTTNLTATHDGSLLVVAIETDAGTTATAVTDNAPGGPNTYIKIPNSHSSHTNMNLGVELWYAANVKAGATTLAVTIPKIYGTVIWEVAGLRANDPVDGPATTLNDQPDSTTPLGAAITTTATGDFVVSVVIVANAITNLTTGSAFTNDKKIHANGWAHLTADDAPAGTYQAQWDQPTTGGSCASSAAFFAGP